MKREARGESEHRAKVRKNENEVIAAALQGDPDDESLDYAREVANDILARRASEN